MKILMVCMGNICRSPMAEGIARHLASQSGRDDVSFDSAGTHAYHIGSAPDDRAQAEMRQHGIDISQLRARKFTAEDFKDFDVIMVADDANANRVLTMASDDSERAKVIKMLDAGTGCRDNLADPYSGGKEDFSQVYEQLHLSLQKFLERI